MTIFPVLEIDTVPATFVDSSTIGTFFSTSWSNFKPESHARWQTLCVVSFLAQLDFHLFAVVMAPHRDAAHVAHLSATNDGTAYR